MPDIPADSVVDDLVSAIVIACQIGFRREGPTRGRRLRPGVLRKMAYSSGLRRLLGFARDDGRGDGIALDRQAWTERADFGFGQEADDDRAFFGVVG